MISPKNHGYDYMPAWVETPDKAGPNRKFLALAGILRSMNFKKHEKETYQLLNMLHDDIASLLHIFELWNNSEK